MATRLLGAKIAVPAHYGGFHINGFYETRPEELDRFLAAAADEPYEAAPLKPGKSIRL